MDLLLRVWGKQFPCLEGGVIAAMAESVVEGHITRDEANSLLDQMSTENEVHAAAVAASDCECTLFTTSTPACIITRNACRNLKLLLDVSKIRYAEVDVAENKWIRERVLRDAKVSNLPVLFVRDKPIGGYDTIQSLIDDGQFIQVLRDAGYS